MSIPDKILKFLFGVSLTIVIVGGAVLYGIVAHWKDLPPVPALKMALHQLRSDNNHHLPQDVRQHLQPNRGQGNGLVVNKTDNNHLVFMVGFFENENQARLLERDGTVKHKWSLNYFDHFPDPANRYCERKTPLWVDTHGALVTETGDLVFNYEYCGTVKLDKCGNVLWALADDTHHSLIRSESGGYWVLGRHVWSAAEESGRLRPFSNTQDPFKIIEEDTIIRLSEAGEVLEETSIPVIMKEGGLLPHLTATGDNFTGIESGRTEIVHANKLSELAENLAASFPTFNAGDLAISMRELNLVMVLDGQTRAVKWHKTGPWLRQHDPEFREDGRISVFNNNTFRYSYRDGQTDLRAPLTTNIILVDPQTNTTEVHFGEQPGQEMLSVIRGQHELLEDGGMIITEFDAGRVIEINSDKEIIWEYVNEYDSEFVGEITNSDIIPKSYFTNGVPSQASCQ